MDILSLNLKPSYTSTNESTVIFNNITSLLPNINSNVKKILKPNQNHAPEDNGSPHVPSIEIVPPSPGSPHRKIPFEMVEINKVFSSTLDLCKRKIRRFSEPCFSGQFLKSGERNEKMRERRKSMPCISSKNLLQVPKSNRKKKRHRRLSLPINPSETDFASITDNSSKTKPLYRSYEKVHYCQSEEGFQKTVHEIFIPGFGMLDEGLNGTRNCHMNKSACLTKNRISDEQFNGDSHQQKTSFLPNKSNQTVTERESTINSSDIPKHCLNEQNIVRPQSEFLHSRQNVYLIKPHSSDCQEISSLERLAKPKHLIKQKNQIKHSHNTFNDITDQCSLNTPYYYEMSCLNNGLKKTSNNDSLNKRESSDNETIVNICECKNIGLNKLRRDQTQTCKEKEGVACSEENIVERNFSFQRNQMTLDEINNKSNGDVLKPQETLTQVIYNNNIGENQKSLSKQQQAATMILTEPFTTQIDRQIIDKNNCNDDIIITENNIDYTNHHNNTSNELGTEDNCCGQSEMNVITQAPGNNIQFKADDHNIQIVNTNDATCENIDEHLLRSEEEMRPTNIVSDVINNVVSVKSNDVSSTSNVLFGHTYKDILPNKVFYNAKNDDVNVYVNKQGNIQHDISSEESSETEEGSERQEGKIPLTKSSSLSGLDSCISKTVRQKIQNDMRTFSLHEDSISDKALLEALSAIDNDETTITTKPNSASMEELDDHRRSNALRINAFHRLNKDFANAMLRKAVSLVEIQNERIKENVAKLEQKFLSTEVLSAPDGEDEYFPRVSMEDCSSCPSCRSRSSSYHSLLYDIDTANRYPIYQPTVVDCTLEEQTELHNKMHQHQQDLSNEQTSDDVACESTEVATVSKVEDNKTKLLKAKKERLMKQGQAAFGSFRDRFRKAKGKL